ncbi:MAG: aminotransferase class V-fold PLP-dependent enzyme [Saprospiraceae bacterium]|nr:aminotransferase class V-fold PLP-dependent enzyme [Bacteroidia bacterium]NNE16224.1 aminotransferase class V-fold PLP-dependent enzyme [Saprospiraceae bacterium]NNL91214.1 aminotransferase class V-fold PLP-dependent enzyme [Saprospiraceae bacterium]
MKSRRAFITDLSIIGLGTNLSFKLSNHAYRLEKINEDINWDKIRKCFLASKHKLINLNSGSSGVMPSPVLEKYVEATTQISSYAPYEVSSSWNDIKKQTFTKLGHHLNASDGDLHLVRNSTEAINSVLWGIDFSPGDEIIYADWDYPFVDYTLIHLKNTKGVSLKKISGYAFDLSDEEIINHYKSRINSKTKLIILTWITHREGRILPVNAIQKIASENGIEVLIDGAHVLGQIEFSIDKLNPDYFATSLHKWLNCPLGSGLLYTKKGKISKLSPPISYPESKQDATNKLDYLGTRAFQNTIGINAAIEFLERTGISKKEARLKELTNYWQQGMKNVKNVKIFSKPNQCALSSFLIDGVPNKKVKSILESKFNVHVKASGYANGIGFLRVSPNIFTSFKDLDALIDGIHAISLGKF